MLFSTNVVIFYHSIPIKQNEIFLIIKILFFVVKLQFPPHKGKKQATLATTTTILLFQFIT